MPIIATARPDLSSLPHEYEDPDTWTSSAIFPGGSESEQL